MMAQLPQKIRKAIFKRDGNKCVKCKSAVKAIHAHHIVPKVFGGSDNEGNLISLCFACHEEWHAVESASNMSFEEWLKAPCITSFLLWYRMTLAMQATNSIKNFSAEELLKMLEMTYEKVKEKTESPKDDSTLFDPKMRTLGPNQ